MIYKNQHLHVANSYSHSNAASSLTLLDLLITFLIFCHKCTVTAVCAHIKHGQCL